jgi:single-stranded DNA-binding protein
LLGEADSLAADRCLGRDRGIVTAQLERGALVSVEGRFKAREWTDRENNLHTTTELVARVVRFLDAVAA